MPEQHDAAPEEHERIERLAEKPPSDQGDQRNPQEIDRHDQGGVAGRGMRWSGSNAPTFRRSRVRRRQGSCSHPSLRKNSESLPASPIGNCIAFIQNTMLNVVFGRREFLGQRVEDRVAERRAEDRAASAG